MNKHRIGALVAAAALTLTFAGTSLAVSYATVTGHTAFSAGANSASFWGNDCSKSEWNGEDETYVLDKDYGLVVVKAGSGEFANTEFENASAGETVWADVNGNGVYDDADKGISHIIFCDAEETTTTTTEETTTSSEETTTSSEETTTTSVETTTSDETTTTSSETTTTTTDTTVVVEEVDVEPAVCRLDDPTSRIQIRRLAGLIALTDLDFFIDGIEITAADIEFDGDDQAYIAVSPGVHSVTITDGEAVLFDADVDCPECFGTTTTTSEETTPEGSVEELTPPSTDTIGQPTSSSSVSTGLLLVLAGILATVLVVVPAAARNRR